MQHDFAVAALAGGFDQAVQHDAAPAAAAHAAVHGHAADPARAGAVADQAAGGDRLAQAVVDHGVAGHGVELVDLDLARHALLVHEHGQAQALGVAAEVVPAARCHAHHALAGLIGREHVTQLLRHGQRLARGGIGEHIDQFHGVEQFHAAEDAGLEQQRGIALPGTAYAHMQHVAQRGRCVVGGGGLLDEQLAAQGREGRFIGQTQLAPVVGDGHVGIHQVVGVEDDLLGVHFGPAHFDALQRAEILALHGGVSLLLSWGVLVRLGLQAAKASLKARAMSACARRASAMARPILTNSWVTPR